MRQNKTVYCAPLVLAGIMLLAVSATVSAKESQDVEARQANRGKVGSGGILSLEKISAAARAVKPGEILETELGHKKGVYVYEVEILDAAGQVWELKLDARTGKLIKLENESR